MAAYQLEPVGRPAWPPVPLQRVDVGLDLLARQPIPRPGHGQVRVEPLVVVRQPAPAQLLGQGQPQRSQIAVDAGPHDGEPAAAEPSAAADLQGRRVLAGDGTVDRRHRGRHTLLRYLAEKGERDVPQVPGGHPGTGADHGEVSRERREMIECLRRWFDGDEQPHRVSCRPSVSTTARLSPAASSRPSTRSRSISRSMPSSASRCSGISSSRQAMRSRSS